VTMPRRLGGAEVPKQWARRQRHQWLRERAASSKTFFTGAFQMATLDALTSIASLPWDTVLGFHMDECIGVSDQHDGLSGSCLDR
jgi:hypothetical protein